MENASPPHETSVRPPPASLTSQDTEPPRTTKRRLGRSPSSARSSPAAERSDPRRGTSVPGGSRALSPSPRADPRNAPPLDDTARARLITAESYRDAAFKHGIPFRPNGLFPIGDSLLTELAADSTLVPFQKNVVDVDDVGGARFALAGSWANGDLAAAKRFGPPLFLPFGIGRQGETRPTRRRVQARRPRRHRSSHVDHRARRLGE